ncbi:MAG: PIN domain-containing protein [Gemmatimonadaceae bacterium]
MIQLDTSFLIRSLVAGSGEDRRLRGWIRDRSTIGVSALAWTEFVCGPVGPEVVGVAARLLGDPLPFTGAEATLAARLFNDSGRRRGSMMDCMIAAMALYAGDQIATSNRADFKRFEQFGLAMA